MDAKKLLGPGGAALMILGCILPWACIEGFCANGFGLGGFGPKPAILVLPLAGIAIGMGFLNQKWAPMVGAGCAALGAILAFIGKGNLTDGAPGVSTGIGFWIVILGAVACIAGYVMKIMSSNSNA